MKYAGVMMACLIGLAPALRADEVPDDVGDGAAEAAYLSPGTSGVTRIIEWDADHDWFAFSAKPWIDYTVSVSTGTILDCEVRLIAPEGYGVLKYTNTAADTAAQATYTSTSTAARLFVEVYGLAEFTTGTYTIAVGQSFADTDADGLPDAWETNKFGTLTNAPSGDVDQDGSDNLSEYLAGTHPTNAASVLAITQIARATNATVVTWQTVPGGWYRVSSANYPGGGNWTNVTAPTAAAATSASYTNAAPPTSGVYRAALVY